MALLNLNLTLNWPEKNISARINNSNARETIAFISETWELFSQNYPLEYTFFDKDYEALYNNEIQTGKVFKIFSFLAIFIASLGLIGLTSFTVEKKTKEIGVRKVLGASTSQILRLLTSQFVRWVMISNAIAWPIAYLAAKEWLANFPYRVDINFGILVLAGFTAIIIAVGTISLQAYRAAVANPVRALKYE